MDIDPRTQRLMRAAKALVDSVDFDMHGRLVGQVRQGGNGGLLSTDSMKHADEVRRALNAIETG